MQNTAISNRSRSASIVAPLGRRRESGTADFDLTAPCPCHPAAPAAVELLISSAMRLIATRRRSHRASDLRHVSRGLVEAVLGGR